MDKGRGGGESADVKYIDGTRGTGGGNADESKDDFRGD